MCCVNDEIKDHLVEFADQTRHERKLFMKISDHRRNVFPLVAGDRHRAFNRLVDVDGPLFLGARMGKILHGLDDLGYPLYPIQGLFDCVGNFLQQIFQIALRGCAVELLQ